MALNTGVVASHVVERLGVDDVLLRGMRNVQTAGTMTFFTTDVPFGDMFRLYVVVHGVASIAGRPGGAIKVCWPVERNPPISARLDMIRKPFAFLHVPLRLQGVIVVATLREIALLEPTPVDKGDLIQVEGAYWVSVRAVGEHCLGVHLGVLDDVCHTGFLPPVIGILMAPLATRRADEVSLLVRALLRGRTLAR